MKRSPTPQSASAVYLKAAKRCFASGGCWINRAIPEAAGGDYADYTEPHLMAAAQLVLESNSGPQNEYGQALWGISDDEAGWLCLFLAAEAEYLEKRRGK